MTPDELTGATTGGASSAYLQGRIPSPVEPEAKTGAGSTGDRGRWQGGPRIANRNGRGDPAAGGDRPPRRGPGPAAGRFQEQRDPLLRAVAGRSRAGEHSVDVDALHTQHHHGAYLARRGAYYVAVVKQNHLGLYAQARKLPWADIPLAHRTRDHAHHRDEIRRLKFAGPLGRESGSRCPPILKRNGRTVESLRPAPVICAGSRAVSHTIDLAT
jgi:hypothetical protein